MSAVYALYADGRGAQRAVNGLRAAGVDDREITVITGEPMEEFEFSHIGDHETSMWYIASFGGLFGLLGSTWLTRFTELAWPMPTGNMPIVAWWPNLIVIFEMTMLGAILATVVDADRHRRSGAAGGRRSTIRQSTTARFSSACRIHRLRISRHSNRRCSPAAPVN